MSELKSLNAKFLYELKEGERWAVYKGLIVVAHPEHKPKVIYPDGTIQELEIK